MDKIISFLNSYGEDFKYFALGILLTVFLIIIAIGIYKYECYRATTKYSNKYTKRLQKDIDKTTSNSKN